jgi:hypothetical protein
MFNVRGPLAVRALLHVTSGSTAYLAAPSGMAVLLFYFTCTIGCTRVGETGFAMFILRDHPRHTIRRLRQLFEEPKASSGVGRAFVPPRPLAAEADGRDGDEQADGGGDAEHGGCVFCCEPKEEDRGREE